MGGPGTVLQSVSGRFPLRWPSGALAASRGLEVEGIDGAGLLGAEGKPPAPQKGGRYPTHTSWLKMAAQHRLTLSDCALARESLNHLDSNYWSHCHPAPTATQTWCKNIRCNSVPPSEGLFNHMCCIICKDTAALTVLGLWWWASRRYSFGTSLMSCGACLGARA